MSGVIRKLPSLGLKQTFFIPYSRKALDRMREFGRCLASFHGPDFDLEQVDPEIQSEFAHQLVCSAAINWLEENEMVDVSKLQLCDVGEADGEPGIMVSLNRTAAIKFEKEWLGRPADG